MKYISIISIIGILVLFSCGNRTSNEQIQDDRILEVKTDSVLKGFHVMHQDTITNTDSISILARKLRVLFDKRDQSSEYIVQFFELFPDSFKLFNELYGYDDIKGATPLYKYGHEHISFLCSTNIIDSYRKLNKLIHIGIGGKWDADAVSDLRECLKKLIIQNTNIAIEILKTLQKKESASLWYFLFDGPHPSDREVKKTFDELYRVVLKQNPTQAKLMKQEYEQLLGEEEPHGR